MGVNITKWELYKDWLYRTLTDYGKGAVTVFGAFILGQLTRQPVDAVVAGLLRPGKLGDWLTLGAVVAFSLVVLLQRWLKRDHRKRQYATRFAKILQKHKARAISPYLGIAWDEEISLVDSPELHRGWLTTQVELRHEATQFSLPEQYKQAYKEYVDKNREEKRFFDDRMKLMLTVNPGAYTDTLRLVLHTKETRYSEFQFYAEVINQRPSERDELIRMAFEEKAIRFSHSLSLAIILVTGDNKVLIVKRSPKVGLDALKWTCSIDEQSSSEDLKAGTDVILGWIERALREELSIDPTMYNHDNVRILSVFLESDKLSISLCVHVVLDLTSSELDVHMRTMPPADREFDQWEFIPYDKLVYCLLHRDRDYDATAGYRMLMALMRHYGVVGAIKQVTSQ